MHSAVWATTRTISPALIFNGMLRVVLIAFLGILLSAVAVAQNTNTQENPNLPASSYEDEEAVPVRRVQRLGDVVGENEWELELSVPRTIGSLPNSARLPNEQQQVQLQALLAELANNPGNQATLRQLQALLNDLIRQANQAIDSNQQDVAANLLSIVKSVNPEHSGIKPAEDRLRLLGEEQGRLAAARNAMAAGRIDQPENNSAWFFYRQVLDQNPASEEALAGLQVVQQNMIARALASAEARDLDSAERLLEDAAYVLVDQTAVDQARREIEAIKDSRAAALETRAVSAMDQGAFDSAERILTQLIALGGRGDTVNQLRKRLEEARIYGGFKPGQIIRDHFMTTGIWAPESVVILAGSFLMGSLPSESGRAENEGPQHRVTIRRGFAIGLTEVTVSQFRAFVNKTGYRTNAERNGVSTIYDQYSGRLTEKKGVSWESDYEGKPANGNSPVIHVSWNDAQAYVKWLANGTGKSYRLPTESEFEYALRGGRNSRYWWGDGTPGSVVENITGENDSARSRRRWSVAFSGYTDKYWGPAPVATFKTNPFGLYDIGGNVGEWVRDCWHDTYIRAPIDGSAWINPGCEEHVIRGGYWASSPDQTRSAYRLFAKAGHHDARIGFRVARDL